MKAIKILLCFVLILFITSACSTTNDNKDDKTLTIYYISSDGFIGQSINLFAKENPDITVNAVSFSDAKEMELRWSTEILKGDGTDIYIFNSDKNTSDIYKMTSSFLPLDNYFKDDEAFNPDDYNMDFLNNGILNDKRYFIPLDYKLSFFFSEAETVEAINSGTTLSSGAFNLSDLMNIYTSEISRLQNDPMQYAFFGIQTYHSSFKEWVALSGLLQLDYNKRTISLNKDDFQKLADMFIIIRDDLVNKVWPIIEAQNFDINLFPDGKFFSYSGDMPLILNAISAEQLDLYKLTLNFYGMPTFNDSTQYMVEPLHFAAINKKTKSPESAYAFIRFLMDSKGNYAKSNFLLSYEERYLTSQKSSVSNAVASALSSVSGKYAFSSKTLEELTQQGVDSFEYINDHIGGLAYFSKDINDIIEDTMKPYLNGQSDFDACYNELVNKLSLYIQE